MTSLRHMTPPPGNANFCLSFVAFICYPPTFIHEVAAGVESRCVIKAIHVLPPFQFVPVALEKCTRVGALLQFFTRHWNTGNCDKTYFTTKLKPSFWHNPHHWMYRKLFFSNNSNDIFIGGATSCQKINITKITFPFQCTNTCDAGAAPTISSFLT